MKWTRRQLTGAAVAAALALLAVASYLVVPRVTTFTVTVEFATTTGLYEGDDVRVMGVKVGAVQSIEPSGDHTVATLSVDRSRPVPADAAAVIVAQSLVSSRFVQLAPAYTGGPRMESGDRIPIDRTAVPVEWDRIKEQLARMADALGPTASDPRGAAGEVIATAADNLDGQGRSLNRSLTALSDAMNTLSDGRTDLFAVVRNLQVFVTALSESGEQIVSFNNRMALVAEVLDENRADLGSALSELDIALDEVERFVRDNRDRVDHTLADLAEVTGTLAEQRDGIAQILHVAPTALSNLQGIYQPAQNAVVSSVALTNFANPVNFVCSALAAAEQLDAQRGSELCVEYLGPLLSVLAIDTLPISINPTRGVGALPDQIEYTEPGLAGLMLPGGVR